MTHQRLVSQKSLTNSNSLSQSCQFSTHVLLLPVPVYFFTDKTKTKKKVTNSGDIQTRVQSTQKVSITHYSIQSHNHKLVCDATHQ